MTARIKKIFIEFSKGNLQITLICILAWLSTTAVYLSPISSFEELASRNSKQIVWLVLFAALAVIYRKAADLGLKREKITAAAIAALFAFWLIIGSELDRSLALGVFYSKFGLLKFFVGLVGYGAVFYALIILLYSFIGKHGLRQAKPSRIWFTDNRRSFFTIWIIIFLCWLPYLMIFFPGCFSTDSVSEFGQGLGDYGFSAHHTIIHTSLMSIYIRLGSALGSHNLGAGLYSLAQMIAMSAIFSHVLRYLAYRKVHSTARFLLLAYFALYPVNALYSITGWKDILFGGFSLWLFILLAEVCRRPEEMLYSRPRVMAICLVAILFVLFRNNAVYAALLFLPIFLFTMRRHWKRLVPMVLCSALLIGKAYWCAYSVLNVRRANIAEAMSVPLQQIARTVRNHGDELTRKELDALSPYFQTFEELPQKYNPKVSDPIRRLFNVSAFKNDKAGFVKIWFHLGLKYPKAYISSFLCNSYGYWYPDVDYWIYADGIAVLRDSSLQLRPARLFPDFEEFAKKAIDSFVRKIPVISMLSSIGFMVWVIILSVGIIVNKSQKDILAPILLPGCVWFTTLASPVFAEYRYVYGVILCAPVIFVLSILENNQGSQNQAL